MINIANFLRGRSCNKHTGRYVSRDNRVSADNGTIPNRYPSEQNSPWADVNVVSDVRRPALRFAYIHTGVDAAVLPDPRLVIDYEVTDMGDGQASPEGSGRH
ncbi:hypothetical protein FBY30_2171 [Arthrobacter sp. SLBN-83]|nr:hypothetical protein FBY30_2171 [Arthrobacter sp. SLBN-83]